MINFQDTTKENTKLNNSNWPNIPIEYSSLVVYNPEKKLFIKFNEPSTLFKDPYESKYQLLIKKVGLKYFKDPKTFIEFSNVIKDVYPNIDDHNPGNNINY